MKPRIRKDKLGFKTFEMYDETYEFRLIVAFHITPEQLSRYLERDFGFSTREEIKYFDGLAYMLTHKKRRDAISLICLRRWDRSAKWISTLAHECFHVADHELGHVGMKLTGDTHEAYAYMIGQLVRRCLEVLP